MLGNYPNTAALRNGRLRSDLVDFDFDDVKAPPTAFKSIVREEFKSIVREEFKSIVREEFKSIVREEKRSMISANWRSSPICKPKRSASLMFSCPRWWSDATRSRP
jgi:hypothetical protein